MRTQQLNNLTLLADDDCFLKAKLPSGSTRKIGQYLTIGRDSSNLLQLQDQFASNRHARIDRKEDGRYLLRDLRSTNGTYVNGARVVECYLNEGDAISFGETEFVFTADKKIEPKKLTSKNAEWAKQLEQITHFANTEFPVLLLGASGTGKEILARSIHEQSSRREGPFVSVNCSALSESLVESELFGHVRGSFTGASHDRKGAFEAARGGTLFLDEIGDLPLNLQPKLLRALENSEIRPVGSDKTVQTDVRIIAATHQNLAQKVSEQLFRADLYFRLNVVKLEPPRLRDRMEDFEDLTNDFARAMRVRFSFPALLKMREHTWPGNIRELRNVVARAAACFPGIHILPEHVPMLIDQPIQQFAKLPQPAMGSARGLIKELEKEMIVQRLMANNGNQRQTALELGIPKSTLHDRIRAFGINIKSMLEHSRA